VHVNASLLYNITGGIIQCQTTSKARLATVISACQVTAEYTAFQIAFW